MHSDYQQQLDADLLTIQDSTAYFLQAKKDIDSALEIVYQQISNKGDGWLSKPASIELLAGALQADFTLEDGVVYCSIISSPDSEAPVTHMCARSDKLPEKPIRALVNAYAFSAFAKAMACIRWY